MQISILALGSRGDILPYATLGHALQAAGHHVTLATFQGFEAIVNGRDLVFQPVKGDAESLLTGSSGLNLAESGRNPLRAWRAVMRPFGALARDYARGFAPLADRPTELIVNQLPGGLYGSDLAEKLGAPSIMAAVVHHGGSGTTHFGLRAGVPSLVVPFLFDQFYWGRRIEALGVGPEPLPFKHLTAERLAGAINRMVSDGGMRNRAAALGENIRGEDGITKGIALVERYGGKS